MGTTVFTPSLEGIKVVRSEEGHLLAKPFLQMCKNVLPVVDKLGSALTLVKSDIGGNITRLENRYSSDPSKYHLLYSMIKEEVAAKKAKDSSSCANGLLWLTRAMDFLVQMFNNLNEHSEWTMPQASSDAYGKTLKRWHGWVASTTFTAAVKLAPERKKFMEIIGEGGGDVDGDIRSFCTMFLPILEENHKFLASIGMDDLKA